MSMPVVRLALKVVPSASSSGIAGWMGDVLRVRVAQAPERGKANTAVENLLGMVLGLPAGQVRIVAGSSSPRKIVEIAGLELEEIRRRLECEAQQARARRSRNVVGH